MIRVTTNNTLHMYQSNLMKSSNQLYSVMNKLMSGRNFDSYSANPAGATRAFKLYSSLNATNAQASNNETVVNKFSTAYSALDSAIDKMALPMGVDAILGGLDDTHLSDLNAYGLTIREGAEGIVQTLNGKYSNDFIFNGAETGEAPFAIVEDASTGREVLTFRGLKVDVPNNGEQYLGTDGKPVEILDADGKPTGKYKTNADVYAELQAMAGETLYVDIGLGFQMEGDQVVENTAFNSALSGIDLLGFGVDEAGDPRNIVSQMLQIADIFEGYDHEAGTWSDAGTKEDARRLAGKFEDSHDAAVEQWSALSAQVTYLKSNQSRLTQTFDNLDTERGTIEDIDQVDAILELSWAQTTYNAALQVGANVIPQSLMDYLQ